MTMWFLARATGLVALLAFTTAVVLGASSRNAPSGPGSQARAGRAVLRLMAHRSAAVIGLMALGVHLSLIVLDSYVSVSLAGALTPFAAGYAPFALGLGTLATYLFLIGAFGGALRGRLAPHISADGWRRVHQAAYAGWALAMAHGILAGTDTGRIWTTAVYAGCGVAVTAALIARSRRVQPAMARVRSESGSRLPAPIGGPR